MKTNMKKPLFTLRANVIACAAALAALSQTQAWSQTTPAVLPDVVVTANRMEQALQTAAIGATVILGEDIRAAGVLDANEAVRKLGGVASRSDLNGGREASLDIRGYGDTSSNNTVVTVDGIRISENELASARLSAISPDMIERIEIIRGGASVIWGEGATGGVINVITKAGKKMGLSGSVSLGLESFGGSDKRVDLNLNGEQAKLFIQARDYKTNGYRDNSGNANQAVNLGVEVGSEKGFKARFTIFSDDLSSRLAGSLPLATALATPTTSNSPLDKSTQKEDRKTLALQYREGGLTAAIDLAQRDRASTCFADYGPIYGDQSSQASGSGTQLSPRVSYVMPLGSSVLTTVAGMDVSKWDYHKKTSYSGSLSNDEVADQKTSAKYLKTDLLLASQTRIVAGYRSEKMTAHYADPIAYPTPVSFAQKNPLSAWELGVNQTLVAGLDAYLRSAKSYRVANVDENRYTLAGALKPQLSRDFELGLKYSKAGTNAGVRVFQQKTQHEIAYDNHTFSNVNLDNVRRKGLELEASTKIAGGLSFGGSIQALNAQFTSGANLGKTPPHVSKLNASIRGDYAFNAAHSASLSLVRRSSAVLGNDWSNSCSQKTPAKTTLDALYRYRSGTDAGWVLTAGVDNISNAKGYSWAFTNAACSAVNAYPEAARSLKMSAKYLF